MSHDGSSGAAGAEGGSGSPSSAHDGATLTPDAVSVDSLDGGDAPAAPTPDTHPTPDADSPPQSRDVQVSPGTKADTNSSDPGAASTEPVIGAPPVAGSQSAPTEAPAGAGGGEDAGAGAGAGVGSDAMSEDSLGAGGHVDDEISMHELMAATDAALAQLKAAEDQLSRSSSPVANAAGSSEQPSPRPGRRTLAHRPRPASMPAMHATRLRGAGGEDGNEGPPARTSSSSRIIELYQHAAVVARKKAALAEKYFAAKHTFSPEINPVSRQLGSLPGLDSSSPKAGKARAHALYRESFERRQRAAAARDAYYNTVAPFTPKISATASVASLPASSDDYGSLASDGVFDRLFASARQHATRREELVKKREQQEDKELAQRPQFHVPPGFSGKKEKLYPGAEKLKERQQAREKARIDREMAECTFQPRVSELPPGSERKEKRPVHTRLFQDHQRKQAAIAAKTRKKEEDEMAQCTFKPKISASAMQRATTSGSWHDRMYKEAQRRAAKLAAAADKAHQEACPFKPKVSMSPSTKTRHSVAPRYEELYEEGKAKERTVVKWTPPRSNDDVWSKGLRAPSPPPSPTRTLSPGSTRTPGSGGSRSSVRRRQRPRTTVPISPFGESGSHMAKRVAAKRIAETARPSAEAGAGAGAGESGATTPEGGRPRSSSVGSGGSKHSRTSGMSKISSMSKISGASRASRSSRGSTLRTGETAAEHTAKWSSHLREGDETANMLAARQRRERAEEMKLREAQKMMASAVASPRAVSPPRAVAAAAGASKRRATDHGAAGSVHERLYKAGLARVQQANAATPGHLGLKWSGILRKDKSPKGGDASAASGGAADSASAGSGHTTGAAAAVRASVVGSRLHAASTAASQHRHTDVGVVAKANSWSGKLRNAPVASPRMAGPAVSAAHERLYSAGLRRGQSNTSMVGEPSPAPAPPPPKIIRKRASKAAVASAGATTNGGAHAAADGRSDDASVGAARVKRGSVQDLVARFDKQKAAPAVAAAAPGSDPQLPQQPEDDDDDDDGVAMLV